MRHTPFDGRFRPFTIGLQPLEPADWIDIDPALPCTLAQKKALMTGPIDRVFRAAQGTLEAQAEILDALIEHLALYHPALYEVSGQGPARRITIQPTGDRYWEMDWDLAPLALAGLLVQEDLVLMRKEAQAWVFAAGSVCFPSSWRLADKHGRSLEGVHAPVPGVNAVLGPRINRIFDHLRPEQPVWRQNWSLSLDAVLAHPADKNLASPKGPLTLATIGRRLFLRIEHQTLRKFPRSGDILFTIKLQIDPLHVLEHHEHGAALARGLLDQLADLTPDERAYKDLDGIMPLLRAYLESLAGPA